MKKEIPKKEELIKQAEEVFVTSCRLSDEGKYEQSIILTQKAAKVFLENKLWDQYVSAQTQIANNYLHLSEHTKAYSILTDVLDRAKKNLGEQNLCTARVYAVLGNYYSAVDKKEEAFTFLLKAISLYKKSPDSTNLDLAFCYTPLAELYLYMGDLEQTLDYLNIVLEIHLANKKNTKKLADCYNNLGVLYIRKGDYHQALQYLFLAYKYHAKTLDKSNIHFALTYANIGFCYGMLGEIDLELSYQKKALQLRLKHWDENHYFIAQNYNNIGYCYSKKGMYEEGTTYLNKALAVYKNIFGEEHSKIAIVYGNIAMNYKLAKQHDKAISYNEQAIRLYKKVNGHTVYLATLLNNLAVIYYEVGNMKIAQKYHKEALDINLKLRGHYNTEVVYTYRLLANTYEKQGKPIEALKHYQQSIYELMEGEWESNMVLALPTYPKNHPKAKLLLNSINEKANLLRSLFHNKQSTLFESKQLLQAGRQHYQYAIQLTDKIKNDFKSDEAKLTFGVHTKSIYEGSIDLNAIYYKQAADAEQIEEAFSTAFQSSEKNKASLLLSALRESKAKIETAIPKKLLEQEEKLKVELNYLQKSIEKENLKTGDNKNQTLIDKWENQFFDYQENYFKLLKHFEKEYPDYHQLKYQTSVCSPKDIQAYLYEQKQNDTAFIEYFIGEEQIYIFYVSVYRKKIISLPKPKNFHQLIQNFINSINHFKRKTYCKTGFELYQLLIAPIQDFAQEDNVQHLLIIPEEELLYLPFEALLTEEESTSNDYADLPYLLMHYDISYHYSATLFLQTMQKKHTATTSSELNAGFIGFAPVYGKPENKKSSRNENRLENMILSNPVMRDVRIGEQSFKTLKFSETEVREIASLFEKEGMPAQQKLYNAADKKSFTDESKNYKYVLIAAHNYFNNKTPELSGIIFSNTKKQKDEYILYISDTFHLQLNSELIVLSSCESGLGALQKGEGVMSMNRGLLYAGAKNIVFTLFKVYDQVSCELMQCLFAEILKRKSYRQALSDAKRQIILQKGSIPKYWAGYILLGN